MYISVVNRLKKFIEFVKKKQKKKQPCPGTVTGNMWLLLRLALGKVNTDVQ